MKCTCATKDVCGDVRQLLSKEGHVGLGDIHPLQHGDRGFPLCAATAPRPTKKDKTKRKRKHTHYHHKNVRQVQLGSKKYMYLQSSL